MFLRDKSKFELSRTSNADENSDQSDIDEIKGGARHLCKKKEKNEQ